MSESYQWLDDEALTDLLARRRNNLMRLEERTAIYPAGQEPLELYNQREAEQAAIEQLLAEQVRRQHYPDGTLHTLALGNLPEQAAPIATQRAGSVASEGFVALSELMAIPQVRNALIAFRTDFHSATKQIEELSIYKQIHDLFQQLEDVYEQLYQACKRVASDDSAWDDIDANEPELHNVADDLLRVASQANFAPKESLWTRRLDRSRSDLRNAVESSDAEQVRSATQHIYDDVLDREVSRVNIRLIEAARALQLQALLVALQTVRTSMTGMNLSPEASQQFDLFVQGLSAFQTFQTRLDVLVSCHDGFQSLDDELRRVRNSIERDPEELEFAWIDIKPLAEQLVASHEADWSVKLNENCSQLDAALAAGDWNKTRRIFLRYRSHVNRSFNQIDKDLLDLCEQLQRVGQPLNLVVQLID